MSLNKSDHIIAFIVRNIFISHLQTTFPKVVVKIAYLSFMHSYHHYVHDFQVGERIKDINLVVKCCLY